MPSLRSYMQACFGLTGVLLLGTSRPQNGSGFRGFGFRVYRVYRVCRVWGLGFRYLLGAIWSLKGKAAPSP